MVVKATNLLDWKKFPRGAKYLNFPIFGGLLKKNSDNYYIRSDNIQ